jgi:deazaflavin-dependent oxidoreductase (nitroreductase family)
MRPVSFADGLARFNRVVTNPVQRLWAGRIPPFAIIEHVGRKSGRTYRTPVTAFVHGEVVTVRLPYGADRDWVRNLTAAAGGVMERRGRRMRVTEPEVSKEGRVATLRMKLAGPEAD